MCHSKIWKIINDTLQLLKPIDECSLWNNETGLGVTNAGESAIGKIATIRVKNFAYSAAENRAKKGEFRVFNQYTETFTINDIADLVKISLDKKLEKKISIKNIKNPRNEMEDHYYNPTNSGLISLGLKPLKFNENLICEIYESIKYLKKRINKNLIFPTIKWQN